MGDESQELKPCPYSECGSTDLARVVAEDLHAVLCKRCTATGPMAMTIKGAARAWNSRTLAAENVEQAARIAQLAAAVRKIHSTQESENIGSTEEALSLIYLECEAALQEQKG